MFCKNLILKKQTCVANDDLSCSDRPRGLASEQSAGGAATSWKAAAAGWHTKGSCPAGGMPAAEGGRVCPLLDFQGLLLLLKLPQTWINAVGLGLKTLSEPSPVCSQPDLWTVSGAEAAASFWLLAW